MRTTIDLPDELFRKLKALASRRGVSLDGLIRSAGEAEVRKSEQRLQFPLISTSEPGVLHLTNAEIEDLLT